MFDKKLLKKMFNFTTNKRKTIRRGVIGFVQSIPYQVLYQYIVFKVIDNHIPNKNIKIAVLLSSILILFVLLRLWLDIWMEIDRKVIYYDNDRQIKDKVFNSIQDADISELDKIQAGRLFNLTTSQSFESGQLFVWSGIGIFAVRLRTILITAIIMLFIDVQIALIVIAIFILSYIVLIPFYNKNMKIYKKLQSPIIDSQGKVNEYLDSYSTTKTLRLEEINLHDIKQLLEKGKKAMNN